MPCHLEGWALPLPATVGGSLGVVQEEKMGALDTSSQHSVPKPTGPLSTVLSPFDVVLGGTCQKRNPDSL